MPVPKKRRLVSCELIFTSRPHLQDVEVGMGIDIGMGIDDGLANGLSLGLDLHEALSSTTPEPLSGLAVSCLGERGRSAT